jgi:hypothetical protein|tara:strand:- start:911 stop:1690 length:780 start_codon:yes stop_codon:yes gene_type:complete
MKKDKKIAWIIGTGPSLNKIDIKKLKNHHTMSFNRAYIAFKDWGFDPTYYLSIDSNDLRSMYKDLNKVILESNVKAFFIADCSDNANHTSIHFQDEEKVDAEEMFVDKKNVFTIKNCGQSLGDVKFNPNSKDINVHHHPNSGFMGLVILHALGYNEIAFVGCDARYIDDEESNKDIIVHGVGEYESLEDTDINHFRSDYFGKGMHFGKPNESEIINIWKQGRSVIDKIDGLEVYSCTPNSNLNEFYKYIDFEDFINGKR